MLRLFPSAIVLITVIWGDRLHAADPAPEAKPSPEALQYFEKKVRPLLVNNCYNCHSADNKAAGGLRVDDRNGLLQGGGRGPAIVPGYPDKSVLLRAVNRTDAKLQMPPDFKLADEEIAILRKWIEDGAAWPAIEIPEDINAHRPDYEELRKNHWAWQPLKVVAPPPVKDAAWPSDEVDRFILAKLEESQLKPVADADPLTWLRRVTYDLSGLPPTPDEIQSFANDSSGQAKERVVDRLLSSPAFGEQWGRHWLDIARYGESTGSARNLPYPFAWRYRDYVIDAFNNDKPYDQFVREQVAGDLLPHSSEKERQEHLIATGFLAIGVKDVNQRFKVRFTMDNIDEQIDTLSQSFLGLTASCARCHDHKFDPISTKEYYGLAGIFQSTDLCSGLRNKMGGGGLDYFDPELLLVLSKKEKVDPDYEAKLVAAKKASDDAKAEFVALRDSEEGSKLAPNGKPKRQMARQKWKRLEREFVALRDPSAIGDVAVGLRDGKTVGDTQIRVRGEAEKLGPTVPRGFLNVVNYPGQPSIPANKSGRLELAEWITSSHNPLTSRVIVNRVWQHLYGSGIVATVDNFGVMGAKPTHPELLDHLAKRFVDGGWSVKRLIRTLVLSRSYGLGSSTTESHLALDPKNELVWRHTPRRLSAEELRDTTLIAAGELDRGRPQGSPAQELSVIELRNNGPESQRLLDLAKASRLRSVYLPLLRTLVPPSLETFDFADQGLVTGRRETTTVATQALYLLNDPFVRRGALSFAGRLLAQNTQDDSARIEHSYLVLLGRRPTTEEVAQAGHYIAEYSALAAETLRDEFAAVDKAAAASKTGDPDDSDSTGNAAGDPQTAKGVRKEPVNPDDVDQSDAPIVEEQVQARDARSAAWASFIQALIAAGEFRYLQ